MKYIKDRDHILVERYDLNQDYDNIRKWIGNNSEKCEFLEFHTKTTNCFDWNWIKVYRTASDLVNDNRI